MTVILGGSQFGRFLCYIGGFIFCWIFLFLKNKKWMISDVALPLVYMQVLYGDWLVKHYDFQLYLFCSL